MQTQEGKNNIISYTVNSGEANYSVSFIETPESSPEEFNIDKDGLAYLISGFVSGYWSDDETKQSVTLKPHDTLMLNADRYFVPTQSVNAKFYKVINV